MDPGTAIASAWASGISMYGVAAFLGVVGRLGWTETPEWLQQPWVIAVALALFAFEFVVDKIPALDSGWDAIHTFIRPVAGAVLLAGADLNTATAVTALGGGSLALSAHAAKATVRGLVNTSPEPLSNIAVSTAEDGLVAALMALAVNHPGVALVVTLVLAVVSIIVTVTLFRFLRRAMARFRRWLGVDDDSDEPPPRPSVATD